MTLSVPLLVFISTVMHAAWNLMARKQRSESIFFHRMNIWMVTIGLLPFAISEFMTRSLSGTVWLCLLGSGLCCGVYFFFLARAYESSDFTIVYPVARALPVLFVALADVLRNRSITPAAWAGMFLLAAGCFLVPLHNFSEFKLGRYFHRAGVLMLLCALGGVGYSIIDKIAAESVAAEFVAASPATAARYCYVFFSLGAGVFTLLCKLAPGGKQEAVPIGWRAPLLGAICNFGSYWMILWVFQLTLRASYVVAFRQLSIIMGVVLAFVLYRERGLAVRLTGALLVTAGLVMIGLYG